MTNVSLRDRLIAYALMPAVTPARTRLLIERFETFCDICNTSAKLLQGLLSIDAAGAEEILTPLRNDDIRRQVEALRDGAVTLADPEYPALLNEIVASLTKVRGIGRWTAEMFLIFELRRLDVWPVDDLGVRQGYGLAWGISPAPKPKELLALGVPVREFKQLPQRHQPSVAQKLRSLREIAADAAVALANLHRRYDV